MKNIYVSFRFLCLLLVASAALTTTTFAQKKLRQKIDKLAEDIEPQVIKWRRHIHQNPELSNREFKTAEMVAQHLKKLGLEVKTKIAHTGVVGILKGGKPGPVVGLRADMDALPVTERVKLPFASKVKSTYNGKPTGVMHACGHDTHVAMLMGVAEVLSKVKKDLRGTVKFVFQPAEEGAPQGEQGGASLMVAEGVLKNPKVDVMFGLHINSATEVGTIRYRSGGIMASSDRFVIKVKGKQTHGSTPWTGIDPIAVSAQIINGLQTIISRQTALTKEAAVISVGMIRGGIRNNIIPEQCEMVGTIRTLDTKMQAIIHKKIKLTATKIAESAGATAEVTIQKNTPVTYNDPRLTAQMLPTLQRLAGKRNVLLTNAVTGAEDFAFYALQVPSLFFFLGGMTKGQDPRTAAPHHTPDFKIDDSGMKLGIKVLSNLTIDYMLKK
ncbi:amidohydrolase [Microscilla marina]|uniref:Thermostable carboxypeptidase 2 n=1 Tax=Microscilla marina ATCC 23134 TaxID=313606 RepID=A1ZDJ9_MICM2|nr:amidohydrolase [Microscilla marina]EAY31738.1 thermostable carboxypeptidase 2 [Microscilla marina ATCC 23134]